MPPNTRIQGAGLCALLNVASPCGHWVNVGYIQWLALAVPLLTVVDAKVDNHVVYSR